MSLRGYLGGYVGAKPGWGLDVSSQSGVFSIMERLGSSTTVTKTLTVAPGGTVEDNISLADPGVIYSVGMDKAAWFRLYDKDYSRTQDAARAVDVDPLPGAGVLLEIRTSGTDTIETAPIPTLLNRQVGGSTIFPIRVTNENLSTADVVLTVTFASILGIY